MNLNIYATCVAGLKLIVATVAKAGLYFFFCSYCFSDHINDNDIGWCGETRYGTVLSTVGFQTADQSLHIASL